MKTTRIILAIAASLWLSVPALAQISITKGATDQSVYIRILDSGDGTPETGVTSATGGLDLEYVRNRAAAVDLTESDLGAANSAHSDGGIIHVGYGIYRVDLPDAAVASGVDSLVVQGGVTGMVVKELQIQLEAWNRQDAMRGGMTALPNANAEAAGGLYTRGTGAGQINQDANGRINVNVAAVETADPTDTIRDSIVDDATRIDGSEVNQLAQDLDSLEGGLSITLASILDALGAPPPGGLADMIEDLEAGFPDNFTDLAIDEFGKLFLADGAINEDVYADGMLTTVAEIVAAHWANATRTITGGTATSVTDRVTANVDQLGGSAQSATDLKDFADAGYDPATNKVAGVELVDNLTTLNWLPAWDAEVQSEVQDAINASGVLSLTGTALSNFTGFFNNGGAASSKTINNVTAPKNVTIQVTPQ